MTTILEIPPITDPLGSGRSQPDRSEILLDDKHAVMTRRTFESLHEYSATFPTGVYEGKMWRRHDGKFDREFIAKGGKPKWMLVWFGAPTNGKANMVSNNYRDILLVD